MLKEHNIPVYERLEEIMDETNRAIVVTATGTGKSYLALEYANRHDLSALVVVPRVSIGKEWEALSDRFKYITYHSFARIHNYDKYDLVVFDEVHHAGSNTWEKPIVDFINTTEKKVIGLTADPKRYSDGGRDMGEILFDGCRIDGYSVYDAIDKNILPQIQYVAALWDVGSFRVRYEEKNIPTTLLARFNYEMSKLKPIEEIILKHMPDGDRKGIVFVDAITSVEKARNFIRSIYPECNIWEIHSSQSSKLNTKYHEEFKKAKEGYMISVDMYNEGLHAPGVNTIIMLRRTKSPTIFYQQLGRALHVGESNNPIIFDCVFNSDTLAANTSDREYKHYDISLSHNHPLISDQTVVHDYVTGILSVIRDIDERLNGGWVEEELDILRKYYLAERRDITKRLPGRKWSAIKCKAQRLGLVTRTFHDWTEEEENILKANVDKTITELRELLPNKTDIAIKSKVKTIGIKITYAHPFWTEEENEIIIKNADSMSWKEMETLLPGRTKDTIRAQANKLGLTHTRRWTEEQDEWLRSMYATTDIEEVSKILGKSKENIRLHARQLGLYVRTNRLQNAWTEEEVEYLKTNYEKMNRIELAKVLGKEPQQITSKAARLGIKKRKKQ